MDQCMKSFQLQIGQSFTVTNSTNQSIRTWGTAGQYFWSTTFSANDSISIFDINGFKNVNIYGMQINGSVIGGHGGTKAAVVTDWAFNISLDGTPPLISGQKRSSPNGWGLNTTGAAITSYYLSKNTNSILLSDPITSVKSINFNSIDAQGIGAEFLNEVQLYYAFNFTFFYKYEGED